MSSRLSHIDVDVGIIEKELLQIEDWYSELQSSFSLHSLDVRTGRRLVDSKRNSTQAIHSWYVLKEAFSHELPVWAIERLKNSYQASIAHVLDPFIGCGTTGVALSGHDIQVDGIEYNPFIRFVASTKAQAKILDKTSIINSVDHLKNSSPNGKSLSIPKLSTFHNKKYFRADDVRYLRHILQEITDNISCPNTQSFLKLGIAKSIEQIAHLYKDGRALRYSRKNQRPTAQEILPLIWSEMLAGFPEEPSGNKQFTVYGGNARDFLHVWPMDSPSSETIEIPSNTYDAIIYSPPYLNNFDYSEVYKLELWMLDFVSSYEEWQGLRRSTIRSHHSLKFPQTNTLRSRQDAQSITEWLDFMSSSHCLAGYPAKTMPAVIKGYFDDMCLSLQEQFRVLKPGGFLVYVVANSRHAYLPIATDLILGHIAKIIGFEPLELVILRKRNGRTRQKNFLRESAVFMRKPLV